MFEDPVAINDDPALHQVPPAPEADAEPPAHPSIPKAFRWATVDAPELPRRVALPDTIIDAEPPFALRPMLFCGPSGCGKTSLACALLRKWEALNPGRQGVFMSARRLGVARMQHGYFRGEAPEIARATSADLLLLDDLGTECNTSDNAVPHVIYARYNAGLPTWVTTGITASAVTQRYGEGITRRISEAGRVVVFQWRRFGVATYDFLSPNRLKGAPL